MTGFGSSAYQALVPGDAFLEQLLQPLGLGHRFEPEDGVDLPEAVRAVRRAAVRVVVLAHLSADGPAVGQAAMYELVHRCPDRGKHHLSSLGCRTLEGRMP